MNIKLDSYEQDIEDSFEKHQEIDDPALITLLQKAAKTHIDKKNLYTEDTSKVGKSIIGELS